MDQRAMEASVHPPSDAPAGAHGTRARVPILSEPPVVRGTVRVRAERCKGCELCVEYCPTGVLAMSPQFNTGGYHYPVAVNDHCICCQSCFTICPEFAIFATPVGWAGGMPKTLAQR